MTDVGSQSDIGRRRALARTTKNPGYEDRLEEIVEAAARVFKRRGLSGASLSEIAKEVGTDRASLYYYFSSKEELFDSVVTEAVQANTLIAEGIRDSSASAPDKLRELVVGLMQSYAEQYPFLYVYLQENLSQVPQKRQAWAKRMQSVNRRYERAVQDIVEQGIKEGSLRPLTSPDVLAFGIMGIVSWTNRWFNPGKSPVNATEIGQAYAEIVLSGLCTDRN